MTTCSKIIPYEDHDQAQGLRSYEIVKFQSVNSTCALSIRESIFEESMYNMALTVFIIIMFGVGTFIISKDVNTLVVAPLERMSTLIKKLAGTICFLSSNNEEEQKELVEGYETNVIESIIEKMAQIFSVQPDNTGTSKPLQMMAGSKHTEIRTLNSVLSIEVVERPRELSPEFDDDDDDRKSKRDRIPVDLETYKELSTLETILYNPSVLPHFRMYLTSNLLLENLLFWQEVDRFRTIMRLHTLHLFNSFISHKSVHQINIPATQREKIRLQLDDPKASIFDESQNECLLLMQGHWKPFLDSKYCQAYLRSRMRHMQLRGLVGASALIKTMPKLAALKGHNEDKKSTIHRASVNHSALTQNDLATDRHQRELDRERELALAPTPQLPNSTLASKQNATKNDDGKASAITHSTPAQDNPMPFSQEQTAVMPIVDGSTAIENFPLLTNNQPRSEAFLPSDHLASSSLSSSYTQQHPNGQAAFPELTNDPTMFPPSNLPLSAAHHHTMMAGVVNNVDVTPEAVQAAAHESAMAHIPSHQTMQTGEGVINGPGEAGSADEALYYQQQQFVMMYQAAQQGMLVDANGRVITVDELVTIMHSYGYSIQAMTGIEMHPVIIDQNHPSHTSSDEVRMDVKDDGDFMSAPTDTSMAGRSPLRGRRKTPPTDSSPVLVPLSLPFNEMIDFDAQTDQYSSTNTTTPLPGTLNPDHSF